MDTEDNLCSMENVGYKGEGASSTTESVGKDGPKVAKQGHVQSMENVGYECEGALSPKESAGEDGAENEKQGNV